VAVLTRTNALAGSLAEALGRGGIPVRTRSNTGGFLEALAEASSVSGRDGLRAWSSDVLDQTTQSSDVLDRMKRSSNPIDGDPAPDDATRAVAQHVREFLAVHPVGAVDGRMFASWLRTQDSSSGDGGVEVMSMHAAKGREWTDVVVAGVESGLLPLAGASGDAAREEARLAYVALTRARDRLTVTWTDSRGGKRTGPSPLLRGLDTSPSVAVAPDPDSQRIIDEHRRAVGATGLPSTATDRTREVLLDRRARRARATRVAQEGILTDDEIDRLALALPETGDEVIAVIGRVLGNRHAPWILDAVSAGTHDPRASAPGTADQSNDNSTGA
jgi:DNA helicase-2/ATP-dependent DNA helicase PcrA